MEMRRLLGRRGPSIDFTKTIHIAAPVGEVFAFWQNFENYPKFMRSYNPPGAVLGHVVVALLGADPLSEMDEDLMRLKSYFESGKPARDAAQKEIARG